MIGAGQQRCVQSLAVHTDSVWTLLASPDFSIVYSGGRDCCVYRLGVFPKAQNKLLLVADSSGISRRWGSKGVLSVILESCSHKLVAELLISSICVLQ